MKRILDKDEPFPDEPCLLTVNITRSHTLPLSSIIHHVPPPLSASLPHSAGFLRVSHVFALLPMSQARVFGGAPD